MKPHSKYMRDYIAKYGPKSPMEIAEHFGWCLSSTRKWIERAIMDGVLVIEAWSPRTYGLRPKEVEKAPNVKKPSKPLPFKHDFSIASFWGRG